MTTVFQKRKGKTFYLKVHTFEFISRKEAKLAHEIKSLTCKFLCEKGNKIELIFNTKNIIIYKPK